MTEEKKTKVQLVKEKAIEHKENIIRVSAVAVPIIIAVYVGKQTANKTVNTEREALRDELINGHIVVPIEGQGYISFPIMIEDPTRLAE